MFIFSEKANKHLIVKVFGRRGILFGLLAICGVFTMTLVSSAQEKTEKIVWERGENIPLARGGYFAEWLDGGLWLAGGSYWKDGQKLWTTEVSHYDPESKKWSTREPLPKAFGYGVTARVGRSLYLLGGVDADGAPNKQIYKLTDGKWSVIGMSPGVFIYPAYAVVGKNVYIFGGSPSPSDVTKATADTWIYDTEANVWEKGPPIPGEPRQIFSSAAVGKYIYVFGGVTQKADEEIRNLDNAYRFDTDRKTWSEIGAMPVAMRAFWAGTDGKHVYLLGGYSDAGLDMVYRYNPNEDAYANVSKLPQPLMDTKFIYRNGKFYGASGEDKLASRFEGLVIGTLR